MDGIANIAKQQQTQVSSEGHNSRVSQLQNTLVKESRQPDLVKESQQSNMDSSKKINSKEQLQELVEELNRALSPMSTNLKFGVDLQDVFYVSVIDTETNRMIRRFPEEEASKLLTKMQEVSGILFDSKG